MPNFDDELADLIREEIARLRESMAGHCMDLREYDRTFGGIHALRLVVEDHIPFVRKKLSER